MVDDQSRTCGLVSIGKPSGDCQVTNANVIDP
jgi:hypothetical protein